MAKVIRSETDYHEALDEARELLAISPGKESVEGERLGLLLLLIENYETITYPPRFPDAIAAIEFRMDQAGLKPRDLIPYLGSRSRVSEVLSRKRPLTLSMIKALHSGLGIPADVLVQGTSELPADASELEWTRFPISEMVKRLWIPDWAKENEKKAIQQFLSAPGTEGLIPAFLRRGYKTRTGRPMDEYALLAWSAKVLNVAHSQRQSIRTDKVDKDVVIKKLREISLSEEGPINACEYLTELGISTVVIPHLQKTYLDGATLLDNENNPVIGLTIRYDRLDHFWYTLLHELGHVLLHINSTNNDFYDDLDVDVELEDIETEADEFAQESLIPANLWDECVARNLRTPEAVEHSASALRIHPAIVAGRVRFEYQDYRILNQQVGHYKVRKCFPEIFWTV